MSGDDIKSGITGSYDPSALEERIYAEWLEKGYFHGDAATPGETFSMVIPPPNVTGILHVGHALNNTFQDIFVRRARMMGKVTVWVPGTDHAGIATQAKVEEALAVEGLTKHDLSREEFLKRVWDWRDKYGGTILKQLRRLGASCDWDRTRFTMDEGCSRAVKACFIQLYEKGLIYQGNYIVNWCPKCHTAISDIEVEHEEVEGNLWHIRYPMADGNGYVIVATTRPETMLGDTAVAVHPGDARYAGMAGKMVILPLMGREIPMVADEFVDPEFGTGAVKVTPAHDPNDFAMGQRHGLASPIVIGPDGTMTDEAGPYAGLDRYAARKAVVRDLEAQGLLVKIEPHTHAVGQCSRCDTTIEPLVSKQWFVRMKPLAEPAMKAVMDGRISIVPERFTKVYLGWLEEIRDWCISRQLWWGHRIPVYYCLSCNKAVAAADTPSACPECGHDGFEQDPDVLDTWFSSGLWPFSTLGWPDETADLERFFPTTMLVTARDIIFFWVARMIFMSLAVKGDIPFKKVVIHGLIMDADGKKMSKSRNNAVDPMELIETYGADTLRFMLITGTAPGNDIRWQAERLDATRNFCNKIWNASKFASMNLTDFDIAEASDLASLGELAIPDRWVLSRLNHLIREVDRQLERCDPGEAARAIYEFIWDYLCDWYIEAIKPRLYGKETPKSRKTAQAVLWHVLSRALELLHPFMPFVTEEIWQNLPHAGETIMKAPWPTPNPAFDDDDAEAAMWQAMEVVRAIRNQRAELAVPPAKKIGAVVRVPAEKGGRLAELRQTVMLMAGLEEMTIVDRSAPAPERAVSLVAAGVEVFLPLAGLVDVGKELARLGKELEAAEKETAVIEGKLANEAFIAKAPAAVVDKERAKLAAARDKRDKLIARMEELRR